MPHLNTRKLAEEINKIIRSGDPVEQEALRKAFTKLLVKNLSPFQWQVYGILTNSEKWMTTQQVAEITGKETNYVSNELRKLMEYGLVERNPAVVSDKGLRYHWKARNF